MHSTAKPGSLSKLKRAKALTHFCFLLFREVQRMEVSEPRKLLPGRWHIQLRLGGESISTASASKQSCIQKAWAVKAGYLTGKRQEN